MSLPAGYTAVDYIESTGTQYINLNLLMNVYMNVEIDAEFTGSSGWHSLYGVNESSNNFQHQISFVSGSTPKVEFILNDGYSSAAAILGNFSSGRHTYLADYQSGKYIFYIDGTQVGTPAYTTGSVKNSTVDVYLFACHLASDYQNIAWEKAKARIYEFKIWYDGGSVARHLVPARRNSDSVLGMYDIENDVFYTNRGSGEFVTDTIDAPGSITVTDNLSVGDPISVSWTASATAGVSYELERAVSGGSYAAVYSGSNLSYADTVLSGWTSVRYRVRATADGSSSAWVESPDRLIIQPASPVEPPGTITVPNGLTVGQSFSVAWTASPTSGVTGYQLQRNVNGGGYEAVYSGTSLSVTETAGGGWERVQYRVRAAVSSTYSAWTDSVPRTVTDPTRVSQAQYEQYLNQLGKPFKKLVRLEFLQPDDTVAFALGGGRQKTLVAGRDTRTFLQSGSVSVNLQNGQRRRASVTLGNRDGAFDYAVNKLWFGQRLRLLMGMRLPDGEDFYFPMGVFYIENPSVLFSPGEKTATLNLTDKWAYLDGSLFGTLEAAYSVPAGTNLFEATDSVLKLSRYTYTEAQSVQDRIDPSAAVYTSYFNGKTYTAADSDGSITEDIAMTDTPYTVTENRGSSFGDLILTLNSMIAGWIGYDPAGALRVEPSQDDIDDTEKPVLFAFTPENSALLSLTESSMVSSVFNDVTVAGEGLTDAAVWARAVNEDPASDTNIHLIGRRVFVEEKADYWNAEQCAALARFYLKRKSILQKSVTVECGQMFHLIENRLISVKRTDKPGSPVEKHLIQGFSIPIEETGSMSVSCVSVNDIPEFTITTSTSEET